MAAYYSIGVADVPFIADVDMSASAAQYCFVTLSACHDDSVYLTSDASVPNPIGILQNSPCSGEEAQVRVFGYSRLRVDTAKVFNDAATIEIYTNNWVKSGSKGVGIKSACVGTATAAHARVVSGSLSSGSAFVTVVLNPAGFTSLAAS